MSLSLAAMTHGLALRLGFRRKGDGRRSVCPTPTPTSAVARRRLDPSLEAIAHSSGAAIVVTDRDLVILTVNRDFERLHGVEASAVAGRELGEIVGLNLDEAVLARWRNELLTAEQRAPHQYSKEVDRGAGMRLMRVTATPVPGADGSLQRIVFVAVDETVHSETEQALLQAERHSRELLQETLDALPAGVTLFDGQERLLTANLAARRMNPILREPDAVGSTFEELLRRLDRHDEHRNILREGELDDWLKRFRGRKGRHLRESEDGRWYEWREVGTPSGRTVGLRVDVTDLRYAQRSAERARLEYESLVDSLGDTVFKGDYRQGVFGYVSAAAQTLFGRTPAEIVGTRFLDHVVPEDRDRIGRRIRATRQAGGAVQDIRFRITTGAGKIRHVEVRYRLDDEGGIAGVMRDITEQVRLDRQFEEEVARLRAIVQSSGALVLLTDADLKVLMVNREFERFWSVSGETMIGARLEQSPTGTGLSSELLQRWRTGHDLTPVRFLRKRVDNKGRERTISITASPVADDCGRLRQVVFLGVDDTERLEAEQVLFQSERLATVGEMAATVAHEIAQPLQVIEIATASAQDEVERSETEAAPPDHAFLIKRLRRIGEQVVRTSRILNDLRAFVRGSGADAIAPFDPAQSVRTAADLTQHGLKVAKVALSLDLPERLPEVVGHSTRLEQVLVNLINNARDAGSGSIAVHGEGLEDGRGVRLRVDDSGPGIPADVLSRLFVSFVTTKEKGKGTGLGLRICRRIVEEMGGSIRACNRAEGGARFEITLPAKAIA